MMCNAGFGIAGAIEEIGAAQMQKLLDVNYLGTYYAARAALPVFRRQQRGHLIVVSSIVGKRGVPFMGAYSATKFAQVGLAECLRAELAGSAIHVSVVFPISTETEFFQVMARESGSATRALGPRQSADDVANAIARAIAHPVPEVYPYWKSRGLVWLNTVCAGDLRSVRQAVRPRNHPPVSDRGPLGPLRARAGDRHGRPRRRRARAHRRRLGARPAHGPRLEGHRHRGVRPGLRPASAAAGVVRPRRGGRRELSGLQDRRHRRVAAAPRVEIGPRPSRLRRHRRPGDVGGRRRAPPRFHGQRRSPGIR